MKQKAGKAAINAIFLNNTHHSVLHTLSRPEMNAEDMALPEHMAIPGNISSRCTN